MGSLSWNRKTRCTAFAGTKKVASGALEQVAWKVATDMESGEITDVLIFDDHTSQQIEVEFRGLREDIVKRLPEPPAEGVSAQSDEAVKGRGRPKLGVVARELTLLPRHWDWLSTQPGGASVAVRKLVEEARRANEASDRLRSAKDAAYKFMHAMAGSEAGFEEAARALFAEDRLRFDELVQPWPVDVRDHLRKVAAGAFAA